MFGTRSLVMLAVVGTALGACSRKQEPQQPTPTPTTQPEPTRPPATPTPEPPRTNNADALAAERARLRSTLEEMVFFDYDQSSVRDDARAVLERKIPILRNNSGVTMRIEGHADERGSVEYNLALSLRRANAARDYLANFGLDASRFEVVPLGEERPLATGASEDAYARNRRGEFYITRGGDNLVSR